MCEFAGEDRRAMKESWKRREQERMRYLIDLSQCSGFFDRFVSLLHYLQHVSCPPFAQSLELHLQLCDLLANDVHLPALRFQGLCHAAGVAQGSSCP
eukprot:766735-Hanusia_phi.AAC.2